ncbi:MAG: AAA family ATPase [Faecousia sp.]
MKNVVHIFGASGSGTTTLGEKISRELGYFHMDTDDYFWMSTDPKFTTKRPASERIILMRRDMEQAQNVVISGSLTDWGDVLIPDFTLAIRIEMDPALRLERIRQREKRKFGSRIEPGGDMYETHRAFLEWAKRYDTGGPEVRSRAKHDQWQKLLSCPVLLLDGGASVEDNFWKVFQALHHIEDGA